MAPCYALTLQQRERERERKRERDLIRTVCEHIARCHI
jgi:hypothetical protein